MTTKDNSRTNGNEGDVQPLISSPKAEVPKMQMSENWKIPLKSSAMRAESDMALSTRPDGQNRASVMPPNQTAPVRDNRPHVSMSLSTCHISSEKKPLAQATTPLKRAAREERTQPEKKKPDTTFLLPSVPPARISRMSGLSAEQHERITAANAKKIEALKLTMAEALPLKPKRPGTPVDSNAPPRKRGRPKGTGVVRNGMKTDVTSRSVGTQSCLDLLDRNPSRPFSLHTQSSSDVKKSMKENEASHLKKAEIGGVEEVVPSKLTSSASKSKSTTAEKDKQQDVATSALSSSDTDHAPPLSSILPTLSESSYSDGDVTPPLSIVEDFVEQQQRSPSKATGAEHQYAAPLPSQSDAATKTKPQAKKKQRNYDSKIQALSKELTSLLSSCEDQQKIKIACSLQRLISEQKDVQCIMHMISRIEAQACEWSEHEKDEITSALREHTKKCDEKLSGTDDALLTVRTELSRVSDQCTSLRQESSKHTNEIEAVRNLVKTSCESVRQIADELSAKMEALKREREDKQTNAPDQSSQRNLYNFPGFFPPPPPPPPPQQSRVSREVEDRQQDDSAAESSNGTNRQPSNRGGDAPSSSHVGSVAPDLSRAMVNQPPPLFPMPTPFYGPFLPPPQKMMYDYHFHMHQLHQQMQHPLSTPLPPFLPMMDGNPLAAPFPAPVPAPVPTPTPTPASDQRCQRTEAFRPQKYQAPNAENSDFANKSRRRPDVHCSKLSE